MPSRCWAYKSPQGMHDKGTRSKARSRHHTRSQGPNNLQEPKSNLPDTSDMLCPRFRPKRSPQHIAGTPRTRSKPCSCQQRTQCTRCHAAPCILLSTRTAAPPCCVGSRSTCCPQGIEHKLCRGSRSDTCRLDTLHTSPIHWQPCTCPSGTPCTSRHPTCPHARSRRCSP